jgi:hypothetical protein
MWFQKQGAKVYYATKNNGVEIGESNAKGFIPCVGVLRMYELKEGEIATTDTGTAQAHQVEMLTTEGRIVLTFASKGAMDTWMAAMQSELQLLTDPRRKSTAEDVRNLSAGDLVLASPRGGGTGDDEEDRMSKIGSFIRGKSRRKRSTSDKEKGKEQAAAAAGGSDDVERATISAATGAGSTEARKRPQLPFSFRNRESRATMAPSKENEGVQVVSTFSSRNIPVEILNALAGVDGSSTVSVMPPQRSVSPTESLQGSEGLPTTPRKEDEAKLRARNMTMLTDSPKLVHAVAPHSPATMFAQVVREGVRYCCPSTPILAARPFGQSFPSKFISLINLISSPFPTFRARARCCSCLVKVNHSRHSGMV